MKKRHPSTTIFTATSGTAGRRPQPPVTSRALRLICTEFDLEVPTWLKTNVKEFQKSAKTRFRQDSFIEQIPFDYLEIQVLEEDLP